MNGVIQKYHVSKNLFGGTIEQGTWNANVTPIVKASSDNRCRVSDFISVTENEQYTVNLKNADGDVQIIIVYVGENLSRISETTWVNLPFSFTTPINCRYVEAIFRHSNNANVTPTDCGLLMFNVGSTALPYQPFETENLFDGEIESGFYNDNGELVPDTTASHSTTYIPVDGTTYTISGLWAEPWAATFFAVYEWDANKNWLRRSNRQVPASRTLTFSIGSDTAFFTLQIKTEHGNIMLNVGSTPLPYTPYGTIWKDTPYTRLELATDTITALPKTIYTDTTSIPSANLLNPKSTVEVNGNTYHGQIFPAGNYYIKDTNQFGSVVYRDMDTQNNIILMNGGEATVTSSGDLLVYTPIAWAEYMTKVIVAKSSEAVPFTPYIGDYTIKGNRIQSGTPTPSNPIDVNGVGVRTENLFPLVESKLHVGRIENDGTIDYQVGTITIDGNSITYQADVAWRGFYTDYIQVADNVELTITPNVGSTISWSCFCYNTNNEFLGKATATYSSSAKSFTLIEGTTKVRISVTGENNQYTIQNPMLNSGSTAKPYEPYGYKIPISSGGVTTNIYLGSTQTVRQIKKVVLTGEELLWNVQNSIFFISSFSDYYHEEGAVTYCSTHYSAIAQQPSIIESTFPNNTLQFSSATNPRLRIRNNSYTTVDQWKAYLQQQYAAGTPVTVWYVLATPQTAAVNEPLMKIGNYADTLSNATALPTTSGGQTFDVDTTLKPSEVDLTYHGWHEHEAEKYSRTENLFDGVIEQGTWDSTKSPVIKEDSSYRCRISDFIDVVENADYTISLKDADSNIQCVIHYLNSSKTKISELGWAASPISFTTPVGCNYITVIFKDAYSNDIIPTDCGLLMLNTGSTAKPYQPYLDWK